MIKRIVRLQFNPDKVEEFLNVYKKHINSMAKRPECISLELLKEKGTLSTFYTFSIWESEDALHEYRSSEYFRDIWGRIKPWFSEKAQAWTLEMIKFEE